MSCVNSSATSSVQLVFLNKGKIMATQNQKHIKLVRDLGSVVALLHMSSAPPLLPFADSDGTMLRNLASIFGAECGRIKRLIGTGPPIATAQASVDLLLAELEKISDASPTLARDKVLGLAGGAFSACVSIV